MHFYIIGIVVSIPLIVHCIKTGRTTVWVFVMLALPLVGSAVYFFVEVFPDLGRAGASRRAIRGLRSTLNPEGELRRLENEMKVTGNVQSKQRYADELVRLGRAAEAVEIYRTSLTGLFADDPKLLLGFAHAQFAAKEPAAARQTLDQLIGKNPEFKSPAGHLLYARALEGEGDTTKALEEYAALAEYFPGAEAGVRYAKLLRTTGNAGQARQILESLLERAKYAPGHYKKAQREWLDEAQSDLRSS
ncbi:MAG: tetratricopeptide repeat protein [Steroidobacteraceae bacterium]|nr:tetratricopeptide repeat protein [Steroidobacteraceae bacterium]